MRHPSMPVSFRCRPKESGSGLRVFPLLRGQHEAAVRGSTGVIRLSTPVWHERGLTRPPSRTLLVHLGTKAGTQSWSADSLAATCGRHKTCAQSCKLPWPQRYSNMQILPLYGRCANERCDRSRYGDAPKRGNGRIGSVDTSMPGWLMRVIARFSALSAVYAR